MAGDGIRAGSAFVEVSANTSAVSAQLDKLEATFAKFGSKISGIGSKFGSIGQGAAKIGASVTAVGAAGAVGLLALTKRFADVGSAVADASARTGASASSLSAIGYAAEQTGSDLSTVTSSMNRMQKGISEGSPAIAELGVDMESLRKKSPEQQFEEVGKRIAAISDPTERAAKAMAVFGKSGTALLPLFADFDALTDEAKKLGIALSDQDAGNADRLGDAFDRVSKTIGGIGVRIGSALAGPMVNILEITAKIGAKIIEWARSNQGTIQTIAAITAAVVGIGAAVATVGGAIIGVGAVLSGIGAIVTGIGAGFGVLASAVGVVLSPIGLVVGAVLGIGAAVTYIALESTGALDDLSQMFGSLGETATTAWGGIVAAIGSGDIATAGRIGFIALELGWLQVVDGISTAWQKVTGFISATFNEVARTITMAGVGIWHTISAAADIEAAILLAIFDRVGVFVLDTFDTIGVAIEKAVLKFKEFAGLIDGDTAAKAQKALDDGLAKRKKDRSAAIDVNAQGRQQNLDDRRKERQKQQDDLNKYFDQRTEAALAPPKQNAESKQRQDALREELAAMSTGAKDKAAADAAAKEAAAAPKDKSLADLFKSRAVSAQPPSAERVALGQAAAASAIQFQSAESISSFSGRAASQQGYVSVVQQQTEIMQSVANNTGKLVEIQQTQVDMERE